MTGLPVTIRLLDPPLHEFLPPLEEATDERMRNRIRALTRVEPDARHARLPARHSMAGDLRDAGARDRARGEGGAGAAWATRRSIEIMHPLVGFREELRRLRELTVSVMAEEAPELEYLCGTMIELPRAALRADEIAEVADFFSFGTNDLTQTTLGMSRDDAEGKFLTFYLEEGVIERNPFETLDQDGVGDLMRIGVERGRSVKPDIKLGICGEHGGEPRVGRVLPQARARLRQLLAVSRPARAARGGAGGAEGRPPRGVRRRWRLGGEVRAPDRRPVALAREVGGRSTPLAQRVHRSARSRRSGRRPRADPALVGLLVADRREDRRPHRCSCSLCSWRSAPHRRRRPLEPGQRATIDVAGRDALEGAESLPGDRPALDDESGRSGAVEQEPRRRRLRASGSTRTCRRRRSTARTCVVLELQRRLGEGRCRRRARSAGPARLSRLAPGSQLTTGFDESGRRLDVVARTGAAAPRHGRPSMLSYGTTRLPVVRADAAVRCATPDGYGLGRRAALRSGASIRRRSSQQAKRFLGVHYLWGGLSAWGFDCSGLIWDVYRAHGMTIPRDADPQFHHGTPVARAALRPGDLLFFGSPGYADHVSIYVGRRPDARGARLGAPRAHRSGAVDVLHRRAPLSEARLLGVAANPEVRDRDARDCHRDRPPRSRPRRSSRTPRDRDPNWRRTSVTRMPPIRPPMWPPIEMFPAIANEQREIDHDPRHRVPREPARRLPFDDEPWRRGSRKSRPTRRP